MLYVVPNCTWYTLPCGKLYLVQDTLFLVLKSTYKYDLLDIILSLKCLIMHLTCIFSKNIILIYP